jgi:hypothetical protein
MHRVQSQPRLIEVENPSLNLHVYWGVIEDPRGGAGMKDTVVRTEYVEAVCIAFKRTHEMGLVGAELEEEMRAELSSAHSDYTVQEWELGLKEATGPGLFSDEKDKKFKTPQGVETRIKPCDDASAASPSQSYDGGRATHELLVAKARQIESLIAEEENLGDVNEMTGPERDRLTLKVEQLFEQWKKEKHELGRAATGSVAFNKLAQERFDIEQQIHS